MRILDTLQKHRSPALAGVALIVLTTSGILAAYQSAKVAFFGILGIASLAAIGIVARCTPNSPRQLTLSFSIALLSLGLGYLLFFPPGTIPDEEAHYRTSYLYANLLSPGYGVTSIREDDLAIIDVSDDFASSDGAGSNVVSNGRWRALAQNLLDTDPGPVIEDPTLITRNYFGNAPIPNTLESILEKSPAHTKIGSVVGILIARSLGLGALPLFYLGRLCQFLLSAALIILAVTLTPVGKKAFAAVALLPMSLHELASYSVDGPVIAMTLLLLAFELKILTSETILARRDEATIVALLFLLAPCKFIYVLVAAPLVFLPPRRFSGDKLESVVFKASLLVGCTLSIIVFSFSRVAHILSPEVQTVTLQRRGDETGLFYTMGDLLADPRWTCALIAKSIRAQLVVTLMDAVGVSLGWFQPNLRIPNSAGVVLWTLLLSSGLRTKGADKQELGTAWRVVMGLVPMVGTIVCYTGIMTTWNFVGETEIILGVQGRYLIPYLVPLVLALRAKKIVLPEPWELGLIVSFVVCNTVYLQYLCLAVSL